MKLYKKWVAIPFALCMTALTCHAQYHPSQADTTFPLQRQSKHAFFAKTNLLSDAFGCPSFGMEWQWGKQWAITADYTFGWMLADGDLHYHSLHMLKSEIRWYPFSTNSYHDTPIGTGHHFGAYGLLATYDFLWRGHGYQAKPWTDTWGVGLSYGYRWDVHKWWSIDVTIGAGYTATQHTLYERYRDWYVRSGFDKRDWFGISKAEISLIWNLNSLRKNGKKK